MTTPAAAAIYAHISLDAEGEGKGVKRHVDDCQKLATALRREMRYRTSPCLLPTVGKADALSLAGSLGWPYST